LLVQNVRQTFIELLAIEEELKLQETLINLNSELLKGIESGIKEGLASRQDLNAVAIALQQVRQEKEVLTALRKSKIFAINNLIGKPPGFNFTPEGSLTYEPLSDLNNYNIDTAFSQRPDVRLAELNIELAKADTRLAKASRLEDITAGIFYENDRLVLDSSSGEITDNDQLIGFKLTIPIPIFDRKQGLIAEAQARENRAEENFSALKLTIGQEVSDALNRVTTLSKLLQTYRTGILKTAEDNVKLVEDGFKQGLVGITDVIQSRQQFAALTSSYINSVRDYHIALNDLQISTGHYTSSITFNESMEVETNNNGKE
jgi:cobalt-zinc-cadmium efflux system outer membrane protein